MIGKRKINPNGYDIVVFDCDSTLSAVEGIDLLAERYGLKEQVEEITHKAMNGHGSFADALALRLSLVKPLKGDLVWLGQEYINNMIPEIIELIDFLRDNNKEIYIVSGGFEIALKIFANYVGIDESNVYSNVLIFDENDRYLEFDTENPLSKNHGKKILLKDLAKSKGKSIVFVGDGITDLEAKDEVDLFVGFGGVKVRDTVKNEADIFIEDVNLNAIKRIAVGSN